MIMDVAFLLSCVDKTDKDMEAEEEEEEEGKDEDMTGGRRLSKEQEAKILGRIFRTMANL
jgi:hypothetical protein